MLKRISINTSKRIEFIDITADVQKVLSAAKVKEGICYVFVPHTTAAVTINENADPSVVRDINMQLTKLVPAGAVYTHSDNSSPSGAGAGYAHAEGNADSHVKASMLGASETVLIENGRLVLGTWQGIYFAEFDGPRSRQMLVKVV